VPGGPSWPARNVACIQRDEQLDQRTEMLEQRDRKLLEREREIDKARRTWPRRRQEQVSALERVSGLSADDAKSMLLEAFASKPKHDAVKLSRRIERAAREEAQDKAATSS
jgi:ribonuclease Y